jgi:DtxR family Mn-dependent transcriptional regulator
MATSTVEDYLKQILLAQQRQPDRLVSTGAVATKLDVAPGTATAMIKTLADSGLVVHEPYSGVRLTEQGRQLALHVLRRHRLVELFLVQVMGMDWSEVHAEAEQLEHVISDRLLERIDEMLGRPEVDPHGDPIPDATGAVADTRLPSLLTCPLDQPVRIARVSDQDAGFLRFLESRGFTLGSGVTVRGREPAAETVTIELTRTAETISLGFAAAGKILVQGTG